MRSATPNRTASLVRMLALAALVSVGAVGTLWATGTIELPFLNRKKAEAPEGPPPGKVPVPVTAQAIPAYTRLKREHFWDAEKRTFKVTYLKPEEVPPGAILHLNQAFGRVLAFDKSAGYALTERELLPAGTRAGMVGGIPPGKRAMILEAAKIQGIQSLRTGDHFDLLGSVPLDVRGGANGQLPGAALVVQAQPAGPASAKRATVEVLAEDAVLVSAMTTRQVPVTSNSLTQGMRVTTKPVQEVIIAIDPEEGTRVAEALAIDATVIAVARTGRPAKNAANPPSGTVPVPVATKAIPAYTRLKREHFWDAKKGTFSVIYLKPEEVPSGTILNLNKVFGRVLAFDKSAGFALTERELLPVGTRAGMVGGIPPGKRALVLEAAKIQGIYALRTGDHFDLLASVAVEARGGSNGGLPGASLIVQAHPIGPVPLKRATVEVLAEDAVLLSAVTTRQVPVTTSSLTQGMRVTTKPVQEVIIAIDPEEGTRVAEALAVDATVLAVARTGRPGHREKKFPRPKKPAPTVVETIRGGKRTAIVFQGEASGQQAEDGGEKPHRSPDSSSLAGKRDASKE